MWEEAARLPSAAVNTVVRHQLLQPLPLTAFIHHS
jgi:hypothetical protein